LNINLAKELKKIYFDTKTLDLQKIIKNYKKMTNTSKICITSLVLLISCYNSFAQGVKDRFFIALGWTVIADYAILPTSNKLINVSNNSLNQLEGGYLAVNQYAVSLGTYAAKFRLNIADFSDNSSLSIHVQPALGLCLGSGENIGSLSIPLMLSFNTGNISTYKTSKNSGFGIGLGLEYFNGGLIKNIEKAEDLTYYDQLGNPQIIQDNYKPDFTNLFAPAFELSYRFWNKSNAAKEISFMVGLGSKNELETANTFQSISQSGDAKTPMHFRLLFSKYLNY
jgi:hypothetical protein